MSSIFDLEPGEGIKRKGSSNGAHFIFSAEEPEDIPRKFTQQQPEKKKSFSENALEFMGDDQMERDIERNQARSYSRIGERVLGLPGDILNFIGDVSGSNKRFEEAAGRPSIQFPGSSFLQDLSETASGGYTKAETALQKRTDEYLGDVASMFLPGGPAKTEAMVIGRALTLPLAGEATKMGIEKLGGSEKAGEYGKLATMFMLDLLGSRMGKTGKGFGGPGSYVSKLFDDATASIPQGARASAVNLERDLLAARTTLQRGGTSPTTTAALTKIDEALGKISNGQIDAHEIPAFRKNINALIDQLGGWNFEMPPKLKAQAVNNLNKVKGAVIEAGNEYGQMHNPAFLKNWEDANKAAHVMGKSNVVANWIQKKFGTKLVSQGAKLLFGGKLAHGATAAQIGVTTIGGAGVSGIYTAGKTLYRVMKSPALREYYKDTILSAIKGESSETFRSLAKLDKALKEEEEKEKALIKKYTED